MPGSLGPDLPADGLHLPSSPALDPGPLVAGRAGLRSALGGRQRRVEPARAKLDDLSEQVGQRLTHQFERATFERATFELTERSVAMLPGKGCRLLTKRLQSCYYPVGKGSVLVHWGSGVLPIGRRALHSLGGHSLLGLPLYSLPLPISPDKHLAHDCLLVTETSPTPRAPRYSTPTPSCIMGRTSTRPHLIRPNEGGRSCSRTPISCST